MTHKSSSQRMSEALEKARKHWLKETQSAPAQVSSEEKVTPTAFTITISREAGARGSTIAEKVGEKLAWPVYNKELLDLISQETGLKVDLLESVDEKHVSWLQECVEAFTSTPYVSENAYVKYLVNALFSLASMGDCIIVGRGAPQILPAHHTLRVRLVGPQPERVDYIAKKFGLKRADAVKWVAQKDKERDQFVRNHFQKDPADPHNYDLVINTMRVSADIATDMIVAALEDLQKKAEVCLSP